MTDATLTTAAGGDTTDDDGTHAPPAMVPAPPAPLAVVEPSHYELRGEYARRSRPHSARARSPARSSGRRQGAPPRQRRRPRPLITNHGRATPLVWLTVSKATLAGQRNAHEYRVVERLHECLAPTVRITLLADRGFGDQKLYRFLETLGWDYVIRFRGNIIVEDPTGMARPATEWVPASGRAIMLRDARVTEDRAEVPAVVFVHDKKMKESWCLATSRKGDTARAVVKLYGRRFTIEETFRDTKNLRFGLGLSATHIRSAARRDRMLLLAAIAHALLTLLGAAGEAAGLDRTLKSNTSAKRQLSLFNQGCQWYAKIPNMRDERLAALMKAFDAIVRDHAVFRKIF